MSVEDKIIVKEVQLPGVDMTIKNFELLSSLQPTWTVVTKNIWKYKRNTYIGIEQFVNQGDVIRIGKLNNLYKIVKLIRVEGTMMGKGGRIVRIKRMDGGLTTNVDLETISKGDKVKVLGRKSFIDSLDHIEGRDYVAPCPIENKTILPCDPEEECDCN